MIQAHMMIGLCTKDIPYFRISNSADMRLANSGNLVMEFFGIEGELSFLASVLVRAIGKLPYLRIRYFLILWYPGYCVQLALMCRIYVDSHAR